VSLFLFVEAGMYTLRTEHSFDAAHFLSGYEGKCANIHGHRWRVIVEIYSERLVEEGQTRGMIVDFGELKSVVKATVDYFDHCMIYERNSLKDSTVSALRDEGFRLVEVEFRPTAESFAEYFYNVFKAKGYSVKQATVYETPNNCACYSEN
jgi:6-pyruvoyltetrahydropterin/6-carboxytetrahydropterin synthase